MSQAYDFVAGSSPLLISMPHVETELMPEVAAGLSEPARGLCDTDWHLPILYDFARQLGASLLIARWSRFNIDLNRPSDDKPLYATATTGLYPDRRPATGVMVFAWGALRDQPAKIEQIVRFYRAIS